MPPSWHPVPACVRSGCCRRNHSSLPLRRLESDAKQRRLNDRSRRNHSSLPQGKLVLDAENRCRYGRCSRNHSSLPLRRLESDAERCGGRDRCRSGGFVLRIMPPSWHPVPACAPRQAAGGPFLTVAAMALQRFSSLGLKSRIDARKRV